MSAALVTLNVCLYVCLSVCLCVSVYRVADHESVNLMGVTNLATIFAAVLLSSDAVSLCLTYFHLTYFVVVSWQHRACCRYYYTAVTTTSTGVCVSVCVCVCRWVRVCLWLMMRSLLSVTYYNTRLNCLTLSHSFSHSLVSRQMSPLEAVSLTLAHRSLYTSLSVCLSVRLSVRPSADVY